MRRQIFVNIGLACVSTTLTVLILVAALELYHWNTESKGENWHDPMTQFDPELGWSLIPSSHSPSWGGIRSNKLGARSKALDPDKGVHLLLGDSVTFGYGLSDEFIFGSLLDKRLRLKGEQIQNFGVSGYGIDQYYLQLQRILNRIPNPDRIFLVLFTGNDFIDSSTNVRWRKRKPVFFPEGDGLRLFDSPISRFCIRNLLANSYSFALLVPHIRERINLGWDMPSTPDGVEIMREDMIRPGKFRRLIGDKQLSIYETRIVVKRLLQNIASLARRHGSRLHIVLSPGAADLNSDVGNHQLFKEILAEVDIEYVDIAPMLNASGVPIEKIYQSENLDYAHYSKEGNRLLADFLFDTFFKQ